MSKKEIAQKVRSARIAAGLTQADVADKLGVTYQAISNYERGVSRIDSDTLKRLCEILEIPVSDLLDDDQLSFEFPSITGQRIRYLREKNNVSMADMAKSLGIAASAISRWEKGVSSPSAQYLIKISEFFGTSVDYLVGRVDDEQSPESYKQYYEQTKQDYKKISAYAFELSHLLGRDGEDIFTISPEEVIQTIGRFSPKKRAYVMKKLCDFIDMAEKEETDQ